MKCRYGQSTNFLKTLSKNDSGQESIATISTTVAKTIRFYRRKCLEINAASEVLAFVVLFYVSNDIVNEDNIFMRNIKLLAVILFFSGDN